MGERWISELLRGRALLFCAKVVLCGTRHSFWSPRRRPQSLSFSEREGRVSAFPTFVEQMSGKSRQRKEEFHHKEKPREGCSFSLRSCPQLCRFWFGSFSIRLLSDERVERRKSPEGGRRGRAGEEEGRRQVEQEQTRVEGEAEGHSTRVLEWW